MADERPPRPVSRHTARKQALDVLYEADLRERPIAEVLAAHQARAPHGPDAFAVALVEGVAAHRDALDVAIAEHARGWAIARMPVIDRNLLRLGAHELLHRPDIPTAVTLDEAVELAKSLSTDDSPRFVNGVLAAIARDRSGDDAGDR